MATFSTVIIILNSLLLPNTEEVRQWTGERTISAHVVTY